MGALREAIFLFVCLFPFETVLIMYPKLVLNAQLSHLSGPCTGITGVCYEVWPKH